MVKKGDNIKVHYTGRLEDGTVFDSSEGRDPLEFTVGSGMVIPGFDNGVLEMNVGDKKTVDIPVDEAYGQASPENVIDFPKSNFPEDMEVEVGAQLYLNGQNGQPIPVVVKEIKEEAITLDGNHPLAGKDLIFDLELVSID